MQTTAFSHLPKPFFVLAPMDDVTDSVFRQVVAGCAPPDLYFTEFVNVDGLQSPGRSKLLKKLRFTAIETPLVVQIWGKDPENFRKTAEQIVDGSLLRELGLPEGINFAGIDLNMGCPEKSVVKNITCSGLINHPEKALEIIRATQEGAAGRLPISVKTRLGFNEVNFGWLELLLTQKLNMLSIHGRTRAQMSKVPADWGAIGHVRELRDSLSPSTLIVGNGDIMSHQQGLDLATEHQLDGVMIGRGVFHDPYIFSSDNPWPDFTPRQRKDLYKQHVALFAQTWVRGERPIQTLNKFCKIYINHFDGAKELREHLMNAHSTEELFSLLDD